MHLHVCICVSLGRDGLCNDNKMKALIVLLLFSTGCWAQTTPWANEAPDVVIQDYLNNKKPSSMKEQLISLYAEYKKECWADLKEVTFQDHAKNSCNSIPCLCPYTTKYKHRAPTFEGFMEWM